MFLCPISAPFAPYLEEIMDHRRYGSTEYTRMADEVKAFREKLIELLQYSERAGPFGPVGAWEVPTNSEAFERIKPEVSQLAGSAQVGFAVTNSMIGTRDEFGNQIALNPAAAWLSITQPKSMMWREDVVEAANLAEGRLRSLATERKTEERSIAGKAAAIVRFPSRVRELTGYSADTRAGQATQWTVGLVLGTVVLGVTGSLIASIIYALF